MSYFVLVIIACISIFLSHLPFAIPTLSFAHICVYLGKLSFPIFAFLVAKNYEQNPKDFSKSLTRLIVFGIIAQIFAPLLLFGTISVLYFNIFFTLALGLLALRFIDKFENKFVAGIAVCIIALIAELLKFDYGCIGVLLVVSYSILKSKPTYKTFIQIILFLILYLKKSSTYILSLANFRYIAFQFMFSMIALLFPIFYNPEKNRNKKESQILFYTFYPLSVAVLWLVKLIV